MQRRHTKQNTLQVLLLRPNRNDSQTFESSSCKETFDKCFLFHVITEKQLFVKVPLLWDFFNRHNIAFLESILKEVRILRYLNNTSAVLISKFQNKAILYTQKQPLEVFCKKVFFKISQNSQENTCAKVSFLIKLQASALQPYKKRGSNTGVFLSILWNL